MPIRAAVLVLALVAVTGLAACGTPGSPPETTVTVTAPAAGDDAPQPRTPTSTTAATLTIPDLVGKNGAIAENALTQLGFTQVRLAADPRSGRSVVVLPENWTVTAVEPAAGTAVPTTQLVVVTLTK
ncbi:PASTA domain-containing protein [Pseudonocardia sp. N23]|uniref:PASTA domain-containing protein n=1 Tax=Pseudonocardia sp. N23 TaxID=1987376 RepID=UPI00155923C7|nr:PASTA domain-containing protein [Pseudonocardia sp. N23]